MKTVETDADVAAFLADLPEDRRADAQALVTLFAEVSGMPARMWGPAIIGFGRYHYRYDSGREGEMCRIGFSPRKANFALYLIGPTDEGMAALLPRLGKHKAATSCLYVDKLAKVDLEILREIVAHAWAVMAQRHPDPSAS